MDAALAWTVVGSGAGVAVAAIVVQTRSAEEPSQRSLRSWGTGNSGRTEYCASSLHPARRVRLRFPSLAKPGQMRIGNCGRRSSATPNSRSPSRWSPLPPGRWRPAVTQHPGTAPCEGRGVACPPCWASSGTGQNPSRPSVTAGQPHPVKPPVEGTREDDLDRTCPEQEMAAIGSGDTSGHGLLLAVKLAPLSGIEHCADSGPGSSSIRVPSRGVF